MAKLGLKSQFVQRALGLGLVAGIFVSLGGRPYAQTPTQAARDAGESCIEALGYLGCDALVHPGAAQQKIVIYWGALAISESAMKAGASHGENSEEAAEQTALANCRRGGPADCKILTGVSNRCLSLAMDHPGIHYGYSPGSDRNAAAAGALAECRSHGGSNCAVVVAPCAQDNPMWSAPLPLPPGTHAASVDPNVVGTWEFETNPGGWIWRITRNGTYEFHSEAGDGAPSHAGTLTAKDGHWTIHAINFEYTDGGTYTFQAPGTLMATGKLGTGSWHRITKRE
jgi:hypothetical protein